MSLCGTSRDALIQGCPKEIAVDTGEGKLLWVLLIWKFAYQKDEWEMIAEKRTKWIKKNLLAGVKYENVLEVAATTVSVTIYLLEIKTVPRVVITPKENLQFFYTAGVPDRRTFLKCLILSFVNC